MAVKKSEDQFRVLLVETILAMCRNTLNYDSEVSVEGLIGITLDKEEIFLVTINQLISNPDAVSSTGKRKRKRKRKSKRSQDSNSDDNDSDNQSGTEDESNKRSRQQSGDSSRQEKSSDKDKNSKSKSDRDQKNGEGTDDLVFLKEEPGASSSSAQDNSSQSYSFPNVAEALASSSQASDPVRRPSQNELGPAHQRDSQYLSPGSSRPDHPIPGPSQDRANFAGNRRISRESPRNLGNSNNNPGNNPSNPHASLMNLQNMVHQTGSRMPPNRHGSMPPEHLRAMQQQQHGHPAHSQQHPHSQQHHSQMRPQNPMMPRFVRPPGPGLSGMSPRQQFINHPHSASMRNPYMPPDSGSVNMDARMSNMDPRMADPRINDPRMSDQRLDRLDHRLEHRMDPRIGGMNNMERFSGDPRMSSMERMAIMDPRVSSMDPRMSGMERMAGMEHRYGLDHRMAASQSLRSPTSMGPPPLIPRSSPNQLSPSFNQRRSPYSQHYNMMQQLSPQHSGYAQLRPEIQAIMRSPQALNHAHSHTHQSPVSRYSQNRHDRPPVPNCVPHSAPQRIPPHAPAPISIAPTAPKSPEPIVIGPQETQASDCLAAIAQRVDPAVVSNGNGATNSAGPSAVASSSTTPRRPSGASDHSVSHSNANNTVSSTSNSNNANSANLRLSPHYINILDSLMSDMPGEPTPNSTTNPRNEVKYLCPMCNLDCSYLHELWKHVISHRPEEMRGVLGCPLQCAQSPSRTLLDYQTHLMAHLNSSTSVCDKCSVRFPFNHELERHKAICIHSMPPPTESPSSQLSNLFVPYCNDCKLTYSTKEELNKHIVDHHGSNLDETLCEMCNKTFEGSLRLQWHLREDHNITQEEYKRRLETGTLNALDDDDLEILDVQNPRKRKSDP